MVAFIDQERDEFDVESICSVLPIASSTYYAAKRREAEPSARSRRDAVMMQVLMTLWVTNRKVYGAHKLWKAARRAGHDIGRDQVARLMRAMGIEGISRRRRKVFTTIADPNAVRAPDLVNRNFTADRPDALWVTDLTYVPTRTGMAYVFHRGCVLPSHRRLARRHAHENRHGPRRTRDGTPLTGPAPSDRPRHTRGCGKPVHIGEIHRTPRRDRCPPLDRHRR